MKNNGSPKPLFETDELRQSLSVTFLVHPAFEKINFDDLSLTPTAQRILEICVGEQLAASEIAKRLRVQVNSGSFRKAISQLLNEGLITYTYPAPPKAVYSNIPSLIKVNNTLVKKMIMCLSNNSGRQESGCFR